MYLVKTIRAAQIEAGDTVIVSDQAVAIKRIQFYGQFVTKVITEAGNVLSFGNNDRVELVTGTR